MNEVRSGPDGVGWDRIARAVGVLKRNCRDDDIARGRNRLSQRNKPDYRIYDRVVFGPSKQEKEKKKKKNIKARRKNIIRLFSTRRIEENEDMALSSDAMKVFEHISDGFRALSESINRNTAELIKLQVANREHYQALSKLFEAIIGKSEEREVAQNEVCPKCNSKSLRIIFLRTGDMLSRSSSKPIENEFVFAGPNIIKAKIPCLAYHCKNCLFDWEAASLS